MWERDKGQTELRVWLGARALRGVWAGLLPVWESDLAPVGVSTAAARGVGGR